jgi:hypothetical protein
MTSALSTSPLVLSSASTVALAFDPLELTALISYITIYLCMML